MRTTLFRVLPLLVSCSVSAANTSSYPDSFELVCDRVYIIGQEAKGISASYISWNQEEKSLTIKSEELSEYNGLLNPGIFEIYSGRRDNKDDTITDLTFKQHSISDKWIDEKSSKVVAIEIKSPKDADNASVKLTDFSVKFGVVRNVTTKHATCNFRDHKL
ncbi:MAG: hypothetical protein KUG72_09465 [Pseudomonadales bacterium]|nr:hypothetical protein [Pseudomonadales bacterium]